MTYIVALAAAFAEQWKVMASNFRDVTYALRNAPIVAVLAWIVTQAGDETRATYVVGRACSAAATARRAARCRSGSGAR